MIQITLNSTSMTEVETTNALPKVVREAPTLSSSGLTRLLVAMCIVPIVTIASLFWYMPPVEDGKLEASISADGLPPASFYQTNRGDKSVIKDAVLIINNDSEQDWTHLNIQINKHYQIYEKEAIPAGQSRRYRLDRFITRTGAKFDISINPLKSVRIYARRPTKDRATFFTEFDWESVQ